MNFDALFLHCTLRGESCRSRAAAACAKCQQRARNSDIHTFVLAILLYGASAVRRFDPHSDDASAAHETCCVSPMIIGRVFASASNHERILRLNTLNMQCRFFGISSRLGASV